MKAIPFLALLLLSASLSSQVPQGISWQAVIRDPTGAVLSNHPLDIRFSLLQGSATGLPVYTETHQISTNALGLAALIVGTGTAAVGSFSGISWAQGPYFLKVELDVSQTGQYCEFGTQQMVSVPYALMAGRADTALTAHMAQSLAPGQNPGEMMFWNGAHWTPVEPGLDGQNLTYCNGIPTWGFCPYWPVVGEISLLSLQVPAAVLTASASVPPGGSPLLARGICYNASGDPTLEDLVIEATSGNGSFIVTLPGLQPNTLYHAKAYATNSMGTVYGPGFSFTTPALLPTVVTATISAISQTSALGGGEVLEGGGAPVTGRGVCWSTQPYPTLPGTHTSNGSGIGPFISQLDGLIPGTMYFVRAWATNLAGTGYGNQVQFTTGAALPVLTTHPATSITSQSAISGGTISENGGSAIVARGVCLNTTGNPTLADSHTSDGSGEGTFSSVLSGLSAGQTYFVRAYATNNTGTAYGNEIQFTTSGPTILACDPPTLLDYDGHSYNTALIGTQCWMKENLRTTHYADGSPLTDGTAAGYIYGDYETKYWFCYGDNPANSPIYGLLYTWAAAMNGAYSGSGNPSGVQGVCPSGWHLPSDAEWKQLEMFIGMSQAEADGTHWRGSDQGGKLKSIASWNNPNAGATNTSGFTALPGGFRFSDGPFEELGYTGMLWTATSFSSIEAWYRSLNYAYTQIYRLDTDRSTGLSVRCVRNN